MGHAYIRPKMKFYPKWGHKSEGIGAIAAEMEAQYVQVSSFNIPAMWPTQLDQPVALGPKSGPPGLPKGPFWAKTGPFWGPRSAVEVSQGGRAHDMDAAHPVGPTSGTWAQIRPPGLPKDVRGPQKGLSGPKRALLGAPGVP